MNAHDDLHNDLFPDSIIGGEGGDHVVLS